MSWTECVGSATDRLEALSVGSASSVVSLNGISSDVAESRSGTLVVVDTLSSVVSPSYGSTMLCCALSPSFAVSGHDLPDSDPAGALSRRCFGRQALFFFGI